MITQADIKANKPVIVKWDKPLTSSGVVTDGVLAGQAQEFITRIEEESELLGQLRYIEMEGETQDIQALRVRAELQNMNKITGTVGAQVADITTLTETTPGILKNTLEAQPFTAYCKIPKTFLKTNIEKENFIAKYESLLVPSCAFSAEQIAIFGKKTLADAKGIHALKGILAQLDDVKTAYTAGKATDPKLPMGEYSAINAGEGYEILPQIDAMLTQFTFQRGKRKNANIYVSSKLESAMIAEASKRETEGGDRLFFNDNGNMVFRGREVIQLDALDNPVNSYADVVIIANPDSIGYGPIMEAESEAEYKIELKSYLTSVDWMFDVAIIFPEDVLYADVDYTAKE
ncbi:MAG: hypothetical protein J6M91_04570 [Methanobrevibacter sp.]|nr:hypothetical protein [Methanobrevibacter sp.]